MRNLILLGTLAVVLAACGVDGEPTPPEPQPEPGITITGTAQIGMANSN